jgi:hypothetical protein
MIINKSGAFSYPSRKNSKKNCANKNNGALRRIAFNNFSQLKSKLLNFRNLISVIRNQPCSLRTAVALLSPGRALN